MKKHVVDQNSHQSSKAKISKSASLTHSIRKAIAFGGLSLASTATWTEPKINPNEFWLNLGSPSGICAKDIDQDGDMDLFKIFPSAVSLLENIGTQESPKLAPPRIFSNDAGRFNLVRLGLTDCYGNNTDNNEIYVDIDADGDLDLFTSYFDMKFSLTTLKYARNDGTSEHPVYVSENPEELFGIPDIPGSSIGFKDIDNDGDKDLFSTGQGFFENIGTPEKASFVKRLESPVPLICDGENQTRGIYVDLNNDNKFDLVCLDSLGQNSIDIVESSDTGYLSTRTLLSEPAHHSFSSIQTIDIDKDNDMDILALSSKQEYILYTNVSTSSFPEFDTGRIYPTPIVDLSIGDSIQADLDGDGDLDLIYSHRPLDQVKIKFARNTGSNTNPIYEITVASSEMDQCANSVFINDFTNLSLVDIDGDNDLDLFSHSKEKNYYCENQGDTTNPLFSPSLINPFGFDKVISSRSQNVYFADINGDGDQDAILGSWYLENIGNSMTPLFSQMSQIPSSSGPSSAALVDMDGDGLANSIVDTTNGLRLLYKGLEPVTDIKAANLGTKKPNLVLVTNRPSQIQIQLCGISFFSNSRCKKTIVLPFSAQEISLSTGHFDTDSDEDIVLAIVDAAGNLRVNIYNNNLELISTGTAGFARSISVSSGQLDDDPEDEGVVSFVQSDGRVTAVSFNLDSSVVGQVVADAGTQPHVAVGNFNASHDSFVLAYLSLDEQINTVTYRGNGTLISQGKAGKSSYLSLVASDILSAIEGDEYVTSIIQQDGRAGLLGFSANNVLLGEIIGEVSQQPEVATGHFPGENDIGMAVSLIQKDQKPAIVFLDSMGNYLATGIGGASATIATLTLADTNSDLIDEGILVYIDEDGLPRWEVFGADGIKK
ncbi:MAG: VCBS repeat-containing protein [Methylococcaceae bacterium]|nr:VCBS repeat-containing protein [Methylococcaceae bacterium]